MLILTFSQTLTGPGPNFVSTSHKKITSGREKAVNVTISLQPCLTIGFPEDKDDVRQTAIIPSTEAAA